MNIYTYMHIYLYVCVCACIDTHMYIYIYMYYMGFTSPTKAEGCLLDYSELVDFV